MKLTPTFSLLVIGLPFSGGRLSLGCRLIGAWLHSALRGLNANKKGLQSRMCRVSLALVVYLIWGEWNKRVFDNIVKSVDYLLRMFQILFYTVLYFHESNPLAYSVLG